MTRRVRRNGEEGWRCASQLRRRVSLGSNLVLLLLYV